MVPDPPEAIYHAAAYETDPWIAREPSFRAVVAFVYRAAYADGRQAGAVDQARAVAAAIEDEYVKNARAALLSHAQPVPAVADAYAMGLRRAAEIARGGGR